ncbi:LysM peptidoglycan-binding domain-containing protein [Acetonema longum]|uniref:Peptidoglycan-binding LysM n=1 Tax=Acetonema longum DSM 6540 TaxID=1009370 RepID=F7NN38_9FIRM|nr:LysM peptidoglycan-binding domain-containing protein [Acetonema longum]EGO62546.1 Peptidoglycan-binding LysM [Acetonema longum DSM 6540]
MNSTRQSDDRQKNNNGKQSTPPLPAAEDLRTIVEASRLARDGHSRQAEQLLLPLLTKKRVPVGAVDLLAKLYSRRGQVQEAAALWRWTLELDPGNRLYQQALADCEQRLNGRKGLRRLLYPAGVIGLISLFLAGCWWYLGRPLTWQAVADHQVIAARTLQGTDNSSVEQLSAQPEAAASDQIATASSAQTEVVAKAPAPDVTSGPAKTIPSGQAERPSLLAVASVHPVEPPKSATLIDAMAPTKARLATQTVRGVLSQDDLLRVLPIEISVNGNAVSLSGEVPTFYVRYHLEKTVSEINGVSSVTMQNVKVTHRYTVKEGDTLSIIARQTGGSMALASALAEANQLSDPYQVVIGDVLILPF